MASPYQEFHDQDSNPALAPKERSPSITPVAAPSSRARVSNAAPPSWGRMASENIASRNSAAAANSLNGHGTDGGAKTTNGPATAGPRGHGRSISEFPFGSPAIQRQGSITSPAAAGSNRGRRPTFLSALSPHQASRRTLKLIGGLTERMSSSSSSSSDEEEEANRRKRSRAGSVRNLAAEDPSNPANAPHLHAQHDEKQSATLQRTVVSVVPESNDDEEEPSDSSADTSEEEEEIMSRWISGVVSEDRAKEEIDYAHGGVNDESTRSGVASPAPNMPSDGPMNIPPPLNIPVTPFTPFSSSASPLQGTLATAALSAQGSPFQQQQQQPQHPHQRQSSISTTGGATGIAGVIESPRKRFSSRAKRVSLVTSLFRKRTVSSAGTDISEVSIAETEDSSIGDSSMAKSTSGSGGSPRGHHHHHHHRSSSTAPSTHTHHSLWSKLRRKIKWKTIWKRTPYYIPFLSWMPAYTKENILGDLVAGITVGTMLVPQGLTYASLANLPPIYGLYGAFFPLLIYGLMGSSRHLSIGPEVTSSILLGKTILGLPNIPSGDIDSPEVSSALVSAALAISFLVGLISLLLGLVRLGFLDSILSKPTLAGFVLAVAATLISEQLPVLLGIPHTGGGDSLPLEILISTFKHISKTSWITFLISFTCCSVMFLVSFLKKKYPENRLLMCIPDVLVVVVSATLTSYLLDLPAHNVVTLGKMQTGFVTPAMPNLSQGSPSALISGALTITILGFVETQLINKKYASKYQYTVSANRELVALGCCSFFGSFFGAYSSFGSIPRTKVSESAGVKSQAGNFIAAAVSLCVILWLLPYFEYMPKAVTSSIIFVVAISLIEMEEVLFIIRVKQWTDLALLTTMFLMTYLLGVDVGIFFAFGVCLLLAVKRTTLPGVTMLGRGFATDDFHDLSDMDEDTKHIEGILIYKIEGALYFANAEKLRDSVKRAETQGGFHIHPSEEPHPMAITSVVFDLSTLASVDSSALSILLEICEGYRERNARVCLVKLRRPLRPCFDRAGILDVIGKENMYRHIEKAVADIQKQNLSNLTHIPDIHEEMQPKAGVVNAGQTDGVAESGTISPATAGGLPTMPSFRRKKSMFLAPPMVGSPLLRGLTKMKM